MSRKKRAILGIITSYIGYGILTLIQFYLSPILLKKYGQESLGAYASILQLVGYITLVESALGIGFNRYLAQASGGSNKQADLEKILTTGVMILTIVGVFNFILSLGASLFVGSIFHVSDVLAEDLKWALVILAVASLFKGPLSVFSTFLNATQNMAFVNVVVTVGALVRGILIVMMIRMDIGIKGIVLAGAISEIAGAMVCWIYCRVKYSENGIDFSKFNREFFKEILSFSKDSLIIQLTTKLRLQTDTLLTGILISVSVASVYYSSITPPMMCFTLAILLMNNTLPGMNEIIGGGDKDKIKSIYLRLHKLVLGLSLVVLLGVAFLNMYVVRVWVGDSQFVGWEINTLFAFNTALLIISSYNGNFLISIGIINEIARFSIWFAVIGLVLSVILIQWLGILGLALSSFLIVICGTLYTHYLVVRELKTNFILR